MQFPGFFGSSWRVFSSKLAPVDCNIDRKFDGELLENGIQFAPEMAPNGLRAIPEITLYERIKKNK